MGAEKKKDRKGVAGGHLGHPAAVCSRAHTCTWARQRPTEQGRSHAIRTTGGCFYRTLQLPHTRRDLANLHGTHCHTDPPRSPTLRVARATAVSPLALAPSKTFLFASQRVWAWATFFHGEPRNKSKINRHSKHFEISV